MIYQDFEFDKKLFEDMLEETKDFSYSIRSKAGSNYFTFLMADWLLKMDDWKYFITLTYRDEVSNEIANKNLNYLIRVLNADVYGKNYTRKVGHSYFSYVSSIEQQKRGVLHFHLLVSKPINFQLLHDLWNKISGFARVEKVRQVETVMAYTVKYAVKGSEVDIFIAKNIPNPKIYPAWWTTY